MIESDADDDMDLDLDNRSGIYANSNSNSRRIGQKKANKGPSGKGAGGGLLGSSRMNKANGLLNDWGMLLPSGDRYVDDEEMTENERWKKEQLARRGWNSPRGQRVLVFTLTVIAVLVRIWKLAVPSAVVSDEQHYGGFTRDYLQGSFFVDVHPPLGKMLFSLVAYLLGFDGKFDFIVGKLYTKSVPFIGMRMFAAACGVGLVPISYLIMKTSGHSTQAAMICALLVTFGKARVACTFVPYTRHPTNKPRHFLVENALITQSRFILLDSLVLLFMGYTLLAWINFYNHRNRPFTRGWWIWLVQTGVGLFLSISVKWVGLFTVATIGVCVLKYMQESRTHLYLNMRNFSKQLFALSLGLLVLPLALYVGLYAIDFQLLSNSGLGDSWVSPQFQMTLNGHNVKPVMADIAWLSKIHMRHAGTNGGWVHSIPGDYARAGTVDQAIQLVEWEDDFTCWQVHAPDPDQGAVQEQKYLAREKNPSLVFDGFIDDGDLIRLKHCQSNVALSVRNLDSIGSNQSYIKELRGIQWTDTSTPETVWKVELAPQGTVPGLADDYGLELNTQSEEDHGADNSDGVTKDLGRKWHSISGFRLYNEKLDCYLMSHKVFRAPWSSYQEVGCIQGAQQQGKTIFIVDQNVNPHLPSSTVSLSYRPLSFFQKFLEINRVMWWTHQDLGSPVHMDDYHYGGATKQRHDSSHPWTWAFLSRGLNYYSSKETNNYVYLMGNPLVWWAASTTALLFTTRYLLLAVRCLKTWGSSETKIERDRFGLTPFYAVASGTFYTGWMIHYLPFFFMDRHHHLYLHHYLPALYFSILLLVSRIDRAWQGWGKKYRYTTGLLLVAAVIVSWHSLAPLAYGTDFARTPCETIRSLGGWEFVCQRQNLALARPQASIATAANNAKVIIETLVEHEKHIAQEVSEGEESDSIHTGHGERQDDYPDGMIVDDSGENDLDHPHEGPYNQDQSEHYHHDHFYHPENHRHKHDEGNGHHGLEHDDQDYVHLPEGPYNEHESEHYQHEHFYHPDNHHRETNNGHSHGHKLHDETKERQGQQRHEHHKPEEPQEHVPPASRRQVNPEHMDRAKKMIAAAEARARDILEKEKLLAERQILEAKQKELDERLKVHEQELELHQQVASPQQDHIDRDAAAQQGMQPILEQQLTNMHLSSLNNAIVMGSDNNGALYKSTMTREMLEEQIRTLEQQLEGVRAKA
ncbi:hypothetical protein BGX31_002030 [Mortierella sp. GBA43]|nr:hypothetical protein BGX31_002030 [Mortierella sp. GBA43]